MALIGDTNRATGKEKSGPGETGLTGPAAMALAQQCHNKPMNYQLSDSNFLISRHQFGFRPQNSTQSLQALAATYKYLPPVP